MNSLFILFIDFEEYFLFVSLSVFELERFETYEREQYICHRYQSILNFNVLDE